MSKVIQAAWVISLLGLVVTAAGGRVIAAFLFGGALGGAMLIAAMDDVSGKKSDEK